MAEKKDNVTSKFKDNVFCMLYRDKRNLLELYNALVKIFALCVRCIQGIVQQFHASQEKHD